MRKLPALAARKPSRRPLLPRDIDGDLVPRAWRPAVFANSALPEGRVDRDAYVVRVLELPHRAGAPRRLRGPVESLVRSSRRSASPPQRRGPAQRPAARSPSPAC
ncbi:hypothetical protein G3I59_21210 [Amycolatopsis rubida]|uniref:Uncharacterized protein n=1 Tax=Amycolatopsis rubida TaxID=112413 RepID=A0ABX0BRQ9_9PSEU|nr:MULTISPECIES: hypothetical protein [Amycolatopsis]MYW93064.1 hypothetical protein [Amycolatopsis rubida]NEC58051.1 hypothetical protein [Amycolatopsis rubida]